MWISLTDSFLCFQLLEECCLSPSGSVTIAGSRVGLTPGPDDQIHLWSITPEGFIRYVLNPDLVLEVKGKPHQCYNTNSKIVPIDDLYIKTCLYYKHHLWQASHREFKCQSYIIPKFQFDFHALNIQVSWLVLWNLSNPTSCLYMDYGANATIIIKWQMNLHCAFLLNLST